MSSEENNLERQSETLSYSLCSQSCTLLPVSSKPGTIKLSASVADCNCTKAYAPEFPKLCQLNCYPKPVTRPIPDSATSSVEICDCVEEEEDMTPPVPTCESAEEGTHEHKYCSTPCCEHNSQGVQPSEQPSSASCSDCYAKGCSSPLPPKLQKPHIEPRLKDHVPKSVEELKASITGLTGLEKKLPPGNLLGCQYIDYRCQVSNSLPCSPTDSQVSFASCPPPRFGFSLTVEPKDHRFCTNPNECKHSKEFCPPPPSPPPECPPQPCPPPPCTPSPPPPPCPPRQPQPPVCPGAYIPKPECPPPQEPEEPECPPPPELECPSPPEPECPTPEPECPSPPEPECPPPSKPVCPAPPKPVCPPPLKPVCPPPLKPVCPPPPKPVCPPPPKPVCPPPPKPVCPAPPKPVCPPPLKPVCQPPPKPVCPPPPKPVCPPPPKPVCPAPPKPACPAPPKRVSPVPPKPVCPAPPKRVSPAPRKPVCPPPPCPPTPPECPEPDPDCPPSPCPSPRARPKPPKPPCAGGCEQCFKRR